MTAKVRVPLELMHPRMKSCTVMLVRVMTVCAAKSMSLHPNLLAARGRLVNQQDAPRHLCNALF